ncbi:PIN domain-containing protein [Streptomyces sp. BE133]|uniref:PIN domain-containing protein n=1 Tax=Streptomyces sp. BE133 TaxID=3002523 RepID=UPI002E75F4DE|nr:PIN domain-containing protein [Streptomyces sp. BE133]MEE1809147.1 PIN domain-containing protein [Streptomyces sp. BE133]
MDSSAIVTLLSGREHARELRAHLAGRAVAPLATSSLGFVETVRTLDQVGSFPHLMGDLTRDFTEILLTDEVRDAAAALSGRVRTLDAIHVASAQVLGASLDVLISYDKRMLEVAESVGLPAEAPGFR